MHQGRVTTRIGLTLLRTGTKPDDWEKKPKYGDSDNMVWNFTNRVITTVIRRGSPQ